MALIHPENQIERLSPCGKWRFETLEPTYFPLAKQFYKNANYHSQIGRKDEVYVIRNTQDNMIIAAVRLVKTADYLILRSMVVDTAHQGKGIGQFFLTQLAPYLTNRQCWCYPFEWLKTFYQQGGFTLVTAECAPKLIQQKYQQYQDQGRKILIMRYP